MITSGFIFLKQRVNNLTRLIKFTFFVYPSQRGTTLILLSTSYTESRFPVETKIMVTLYPIDINSLHNVVATLSAPPVFNDESVKQISKTCPPILYSFNLDHYLPLTAPNIFKIV